MISKRPILIVASPRSGSSPYCFHVGRTHGLTIWAEPTRDAVEFKEFQKFIHSTNKAYILKIITYQIADTPVYQRLLYTDCYKIKLTRQNKVDQIVSEYIGKMTGVYNSEDKFARGTEYTVPIDAGRIQDTILYIQKTDSIFDLLNVKFDEELTYEELVRTSDFSNTNIVKIIPPTNYLQLKEIIEHEYNKSR